MQKGLFIGLGGAGMKTVAKLKALLFQRAYNSSKAAMDDDCSFIFYDTDRQTEQGINNDYGLQRMMGGFPVIDYEEYIHAGSVNPYQLYQIAKNAPASDVIGERLLEWAIDPAVHGCSRPFTEPLIPALEPRRMAGRYACEHKIEELESKITKGILKFVGQPLFGNHPIVWVFSSCVGGTGSSALLDVLYLIDRLYKMHVIDYAPDLRLVLYMPKSFIDKNQMNGHYYSLNAYCTLWELNAFRADAVLDYDGKKFGAFAVQPDKDRWAEILTPWEVCSYVLAVDAESQNAVRVSIDQMYNNTAELCYLMQACPVGQAIAAHLDVVFCGGGPYYNGYEVSHPDERRWSKFLVGSGFKTIAKADDLLKEYVRSRFFCDFYSLGLLGPRFEEVLPTPDQQKEAAKAFAEKYILNHLINIDHFEISPKDSLYAYYRRSFESVMMPDEEEIPSRDEWNYLGEMFVNECKYVDYRLSTEFNSDKASANSKMAWIKRIEESLKQGVDECILDYGLEYTYCLLALVDDFFRMDILGRHSLWHRRPLMELESEIEQIVQDNRRGFARRRAMGDLVFKMREYKQACIDELAIQHIEDIIQNITHEKSGVLVCLRRGDAGHKGLLGMTQVFHDKFHESIGAYHTLAHCFKETAKDVCVDYFPPVSEFVQEDESWVQGHLFEDLYTSIVPANKRGFMVPIIKAVLSRVPGQMHWFTDMAWGNPLTQFDTLFKAFVNEVGVFVEDAMNDSNYAVKSWLDMPLEPVFDGYFSNNDAARDAYIDRFVHSVPVFYPTSQGRLPQEDKHWCCSGESQLFTCVDPSHPVGNVPFYQDASLGHRFVFIKLVSGYSFVDYKYFDMLNGFYEEARPRIESGEIGCHIHQDFLKCDLEYAYSKHEAKRFDKFIALCWYDCFFEYLDSLQNKDCVEAFFGNQSKYEPIVTITTGDKSEVSFKEMGLRGDRLFLAQLNNKVLRFHPHSLFELRKAVSDFDLDYKIYFDQIAKVFAIQSNEIKEEIKRLYCQASTGKEDTCDGEIWRIFTKKLAPLFDGYTKTQNDKKIIFLIGVIVSNMRSNNIFY